MRNFLHHLFVSGEHNNHRPHMLRPYMILLLAFISILIFIFVVFQQYLLTKTDLLASIYPKVLAQLTNEDRNKASLSELTTNPVLEEVARLKAEDMAAHGYFAHNSPTGVTPWHWFAKAGYEYDYAGENLAINFSDSKDVVEAWMNSPTHRANILNNNYTEIGIATARGTYEGKEAVWVVQSFGKPKSAPRFAIVQQEEFVEPSVPVSSPEETGRKNSPEDTIVSTEILGVEDEVASVTMESFAATGSPEAVAEARSVTQPAATSLFAFLATNPQAILALVFFLIGGAVFIALLLLIFAEVSHHHVRQAIMATVFLLLLIALFVVYRHFFLESFAIS